MTRRAHPSQELVGGLLQAIDSLDLPAMEQHVEALRGSLAAGSPPSSFDAERLDALDGLADEIDSCLRRMRTAAAGEMARIRAAAPLLLHVARGGPAPLSEQ